jgi:hypothetical protein
MMDVIGHGTKTDSPEYRRNTLTASPVVLWSAMAVGRTRGRPATYPFPTPAPTTIVELLAGVNCCTTGCEFSNTRSAAPAPDMLYMVRAGNEMTIFRAALEDTLTYETTNDGFDHSAFLILVDVAFVHH